MATVVIFSGQYDLSCQPAFISELDAVAKEPVAILDFTQVTFVDSTCLSELVRVNNARRSAHLAPPVLIVKPGSLVDRILNITYLNRAFTVVSSLDEALSKDGSKATIRHAVPGGDEQASSRGPQSGASEKDAS